MLARGFGINTAQFGLLVASYTFAGAVSGFFFPLWADCFECRQALFVVYGLFIVSTLACAVAPSYEALLWAKGVAGIFGGIVSALVNTLVADRVTPYRLGQAMGHEFLTAFPLASVLVLGVPAAL